MNEGASQHLDLVIVGAGPVGLAAGIEAKQRGLRALLVDRGTIVNSIYRFPSNLQFFSSAENLEIGGHPLISQAAKPTRDEVYHYYRRVAENEALNIETYTETADIRSTEDGFEVGLKSRSGTESKVRSRFVMIATGYFDNPKRLGVPGENLPHVRSRFVDTAPYWQQRVSIVGGSNSAVETALSLYRGGAHVTLIHRGDRVAPRVKYWLRPDFENRVAEGAIDTVMNAEVEEFTTDAVIVSQAGDHRSIPTDFALVFIGYHAVDGLLRDAGVRFQGGAPQLSDSFETSEPGLFVAGSAGFGEDIQTVFIENGRIHAAAAVAEMASRLDREVQ